MRYIGMVVLLVGDFNVNITKGKWLPEYMLGQYGMYCCSQCWGSLPTTIRGTCTDLVFGNLDAMCVGMLGMPLAVYQSNDETVLIKLSKTPSWLKREYRDVTAREYAGNWTVDFEVVETPIGDGDHAGTEDAEIEEECDVYRAEDALQV